MTRDQFLVEFRRACQSIGAELFSAVPTAYPLGDRIRVRVLRTAGTRGIHAIGLPTPIDPLQAVWLARTGEIRSVIECYDVARALGLSKADTAGLLAASDYPLETLTRPEEKYWRLGLLCIVERLPLGDPMGV